MTDTTTPKVTKEAEDTTASVDQHFRAVDPSQLSGEPEASVWAATFVKTLKAQDDPATAAQDEGWLVGWFASAMMAWETELERQGRLVESQVPIPDGWNTDNLFTEKDTPDIISLVYQLVGAGSVCWEHMEFTGIFDDRKAVMVAEAGIKRLKELGVDVEELTA